MKKNFFSVHEGNTIEFINTQSQNGEKHITSFIEGNYGEIREETRYSVNDQHVVLINVKKYNLEGNSAYIIEEIEGFSKEIPYYSNSGSSHYTYTDNGDKILSKRITVETKLDKDEPFKSTSTKNTLIFAENGTKISEVSVEKNVVDIKGSNTITHNYKFRQPVSHSQLQDAIKDSDNLVDIQEEQF